MIEISAALKLIDESVSPLATERVPLTRALGRVLAEPIASDVDSPPHDKALMDGYAVVASDLAPGKAALIVGERITAGMVPKLAVEPGRCAQIMTGAPIPPGADAVVRVEASRELKEEGREARVELRDASVQSGSNIMRRAASMSRGQVVLEAGRMLRPAEIGLLAEVGCDQVSVRARARVAILATGNELVACRVRPGPGQIRNSNGPMLHALAEVAHASVNDLGIARDDRARLSDGIRRGLEADLLLLTGGVSVGVLDLVPDVLAEAGVEPIFHKVNIRPGKPVWFGIRRSDSPTVVFGLPGNPVSSLVGFVVFVRAALSRMSGHAMAAEPEQAMLGAAFDLAGDRPTYWPCRLANGVEGCRIHPLQWKGSGDQKTVAEADALAVFPRGNTRYEPGQSLEILRI